MKTTGKAVIWFAALMLLAGGLFRGNPASAYPDHIGPDDFYSGVNESIDDRRLRNYTLAITIALTGSKRHWTRTPFSCIF